MFDLYLAVRFFGWMVKFMFVTTAAVIYVMILCTQAILTLALRAIAYVNGSKAKDT